MNFWRVNFFESCCPAQFQFSIYDVPVSSWTSFEVEGNYVTHVKMLAWFSFFLFLGTKTDACFISGHCFAKNDSKPSDWCQQCLPEVSTTTWTERRGKKLSEALIMQMSLSSINIGERRVTSFKLYIPQIGRMIKAKWPKSKCVWANLS
jgi:hypothetical protein